ncbi:MAG: WYL domain-containing transcriptional regulator [Campylobacterota bacterium]|nr:WYL domain-containing transcriptional regulator [Campylobacterota bacterium]
MQYKHNYDKALFRYTQIIAKLYGGAKLSNIELAEEFQVSTKTIQRDFSKLVLIFPIFQDKKLWQLEKEFEFKENLSIEDDITLKLLSQASKSFDKSFSKRADKLLSRIDDNINSPIYTKIELEDISNKLQEYSQIEKAINSNHKIEIVYTVDDYSYETVINPYKIVNFEGFWYLIAKRKGNLRRYYLQNVFNVEILEDKFRKSKKIEELISNAINIWFDETDGFEVELLIDKSISKYFMRKPISSSQRLKEFDKDENMIITLDITNEKEIIPIVKYWLPNIKVLKPSGLNEKIKEEVQKFLKWT